MIDTSVSIFPEPTRADETQDNRITQIEETLETLVLNQLEES